MRYYFAPMEGITDSVYRAVHHEFFPGIDRYYIPFLSPTVHRTLTSKERRELPRADTMPFEAIPQILTKVPEDFLWAARQCEDLGYKEINLNTGCPSGTVVAKGKGSGMLADPDALDQFFNEIFSKATLPVSVKTRVGLNSPDEFPLLMEVFNRYPIEELTVHPRIRKDFYQNIIRMDSFAYAVENSINPLCFNGNLCCKENIDAISSRFPQIEAVMIGRGLVGNPGMLSPEGTSAETLERMHNRLLEEYLVLFGGSRNAMFRLKENWSYLIHNFENHDKLWKKLKKSTDLQEYRSITAEIFHTLSFNPHLPPDW